MSRGDKRDRDRAKNQAKQLAKSKSQSKVGQYRTSCTNCTNLRLHFFTIYLD
jgi:4F5 protein family.